jgi:meso-butanediol dehydrogenase/(S,S)-butanediol dehydrogenase/diacetyl reductase
MGRHAGEQSEKSNSVGNEEERVRRSVEGKVVIVTGAGRGLGAGMVKHLAENGAKVGVADINKDNAEAVAEQIRGDGGEAIALGVDVAERAQVRGIVGKVVEKYGRLDVMFNNAGISQTCPFMDITEEDFNRIIRVNALGVMIGIQEAARQMISQGAGKIINTSSIAGKQGWEHYAHYCVAKFGVVALTQSAARALSKHGITVNNFAPGIVVTELWENLEKEAKQHGVFTDPEQKMIDAFSKDILIGRPALPRDLAGVTTFLASDDASYINGQTIMIDGGMVLI